MRTILVLVLICVIPRIGNAQALAMSPSVVVFDDDAGVVGLNSRSQVAVAADGSLFFLSASRDGVYQLRKNSRHVLRIGRKGAGPGEYQRIQSFGWIQDTMWIGDDGNRRITYLAQMGRGAVRTVSFLGTASLTALLTVPLSVTPSGKAICGLTPLGNSSSIDPASREPLARVSRDGIGAYDTLMLLETRNRNHKYNNGAARVVGVQVMSDATLWSLSRNGKFALMVERSDELAQQGKPWKVSVMETNGRTVYQRGFPAPTHRTSSADVQRVVEKKIATFNADAREDWIPRLTADIFKQGLFVPQFRVPVVEAVIGDDGTVLLRGNDWNASQVEYTWLRMDGSVRGSFTVPSTRHVRAVLGDLVWSIDEDGDGAVRVVRQAIQSTKRQ